MALLNIPLTPEPQMFRVVLGTTTYQMILRYRNWTDAGWVMDINDSAGNPIACALPLVTGSGILDQLKYLGIGGDHGNLFIFSFNGDFAQVPGFTDLGNPTRLFWDSLG